MFSGKTIFLVLKNVQKIEGDKTRICYSNVNLSTLNCQSRGVSITNLPLLNFYFYKEKRDKRREKEQHALTRKDSSQYDTVIPNPDLNIEVGKKSNFPCPKHEKMILLQGF